MSYLSKSKLTSRRAAFSMNSRGDTRAAVAPTVPAPAPREARPAPPSLIDDCAAAAWGRLAAVEPAEGLGAEAEAGIVAGCFAHPVATRIRSAVGIISTLLMSCPPWLDPAGSRYFLPWLSACSRRARRSRSLCSSSSVFLSLVCSALISSPSWFWTVRISSRRRFAAVPHRGTRRARRPPPRQSQSRLSAPCASNLPILLRARPARAVELDNPGQGRRQRRPPVLSSAN